MSVHQTINTISRIRIPRVPRLRRSVEIYLSVAWNETENALIKTLCCFFTDWVDDKQYYRKEGLGNSLFCMYQSK